MRPETLKSIAEIDMILTAHEKGVCPANCRHCGAFGGENPEDGLKGKQDQLSEAEINQNLDRELGEIMGHARLNISELYAELMYTGVNTDPLFGKAFYYAAKKVHAQTSGRSSMMCITHGLHVKPANSRREEKVVGDMEENMDEIIGLMKEGIVRVFILTVDNERLGGKLAYNENKLSYIRTLEKLKPFLTEEAQKKHDLRITISIQGEDTKNPEDDFPNSNINCYSRDFVYKMYQEILNEAGITSDMQRFLNVELDRSRVKLGRSLLHSNLDPSAQCDVAPDKELNKKIFDRKRQEGKWATLRVMQDGSVQMSALQPGRTYNDALLDDKWVEIAGTNPIEVISLKSILPENEKIDWKDTIQTDEDIFKVWPLSLINEDDRPKILNRILGRIDRKSLISIKFPVFEDGELVEARTLRYSEIKRSLVKWLIPRKRIDRYNQGDYFRAEEDATDDLIWKEAPYLDILKCLEKKGYEIPVTMYKCSYFSGEAKALARLLKDECGVDYIFNKVMSRELSITKSARLH